jgi:hypothetical protein
MAKPLPRKQRVLNRGYLYTRTADEVGELSVKLIDIDSAILYYFENIIQPSVEDNGENVKVPIMYASPERWKAIQRDGFMKDKKRQTITPVIAYRRTSIERDDSIPQDKLDANNPNMFYTFEKQFSQENRYDNFTLQQGLLPQKEYYNVTFPDYVVLNYDFIVWTTYIEQMNKIVEKVIYSDGAYWGDPEKLRFRSRIESFTDTTEVSDVERLVRTNFSVTLRGYLLPDGNFDHRSTTQKHITPKKVILGTETDSIIDKKIGRSGQFTEDVSDTISAPSSPAESTGVSTELSNPITFNQGTGVTLSQNGVSFDGSTAVDLTISIGQDVSTTSNVTFNQVSASSVILGTTTIDGSDITGNLGITGSVTLTGDFSVSGDTTIGGIVTAQEFHTEFVSASIIYTSGSSQFGDTLDDTHNFTGSLDITGSYTLNGYQVTEISNDTTLADSSATALVTENAAKTYIDTTVLASQTYLRKSFFKKNTSITGTSTASFNAVTASAPTSLTDTNENDFVFFINGQYMEHDALTIQQSSTTFLLKVDNSSIGYDLESDDEIIAVGKFDS